MRLLEIVPTTLASSWVRSVFLAPLILVAGHHCRLLGDVIHLRNGRTIEGTVAAGAKKGTVEIRTGEGTTLVVAPDEIVKIDKRQSPREEFEVRLGRIAPGDLDAFEDLVVWARDRQLTNRAKTAARRVLEIDPNSELARKELGYVVFENRWISETELKKRKDLVRHRGEWMTAAEKQRREADEAVAEMEELMGLLAHDNQHLQEFALQKLLSIREPAAREAFARRLQDEREGVRWVAVRGLANFPVTGAGDDRARTIAADLHRLFLAEKSEKSLAIYHFTLARFFPSESRRLVEEVVARSTSESERKRAREMLVRISAPSK